jgi:flavin-dependent dehydrogenase
MFGRSQTMEVVIVGGGPAGLTTALAIARAEPALTSKIVVLEKGVYPREKYCAGALGRRGDKILSDLDARPDVPSVRIDGISFRALEGEMRAEVGEIGRVVRRIEFDHALAKSAIARGIQVIDGARVDRVEKTMGAATVVSSKGTFSAPVVIGADGVGGVVRKAMGHGAGKHRAQVLEIDTEPVPGDRDRRTLHFDASDRELSGYYWDFPTIVDGRELVSRGIYHLKVDDGPMDLHARFAERLAKMGLKIDDYKNKRFAERGYEPALTLVDGALLLVGESAGIDPISGEGIAQAIEYGALAGAFVAEVAAERRVLSDWTTTLRKSRLGIDLHVRTKFIDSFYGAIRSEVEGLLVREATALRSGCRHFAALPPDKLDLARLAFRAGSGWLSAKARVRAASSR